MTYRIVTDSSANLTNELIDRYQLDILSLVFMAGEQEYLSYIKGAKNDLKQFYTMMREKKNITTSCISPKSCYDCFEPILQAGEDLLYIGFSSGLSNTYQVAHTILEEMREKYPERNIFDVDTLAASMGEGLLVTYAAQQREEGKSITETYEWLMSHRLNLCHWFTVDDLFFLKRGGRISAATAVMGTVLSIKPVMHVNNEGHLIALAKVRGRKQSLDALVQRMVKTAIDPASQIVYISHGDCLEDAEYIAAAIKEKLSPKSVVINYVDPVVGAHSGPGTVALFFLGTHR